MLSNVHINENAMTNLRPLRLQLQKRIQNLHVHTRALIYRTKWPVVLREPKEGMEIPLE